MSTNRTSQMSIKAVDDAGGRSADFWADVPQTSTELVRTSTTSSAMPGADDPLYKVKRLLRGRWPLLIGLAAGGGVLGAAAGYSLTSPTYRSSGRVTIQPSIEGFEGDQRVVESYVSFMRNERERITQTPAIAQQAVETEIWKSLDMGWEPAVFQNFLEASRNEATWAISIGFEHPSPTIAVKGTLAALEAYENDFRRRQLISSEQVDGSRNRQRSAYVDQLNRVESEISQIAKGYQGTENLGGIYDRMQSDLDRDEALLNSLEQDLRRAEQYKGRAGDLTPEALADGDGELRNLLALRAQTRAELRQLKRGGLGDKAASVVTATENLSFIEELIEAQADKVRQTYYGTMPNIADGGSDRVDVTADFIEGLRARIENLRPIVESGVEGLSLIASDREALERATRRRGELEDDIKELDALIREDDRDMQVRQALKEADMDAISVVKPKDLPSSASVAKDARSATALGGAILGAGIPAGLVLLFGLFDKRTRYSDDAIDLAAEMPSGPNGRHVPMLGVLPDLPDRLSDPNQASIAAHCVHQIRTILQIHHAVPATGDATTDKPRAFAVTSAGREDGKTSLCLALGLSYAASGCRTLLVDADLRGGGLSKRMKVKGDEGVLDALLGNDFLGVTCETDVPDLAVLPIGNATEKKAGVFSPSAVARLVREAKKHFDVILLDCGPILGSIETTPVASAADATILTVSRNQNKETINKAAKHLNDVGATVAGIVFNRAGSADFDRSVAGMNYRSSAAAMPDRSRKTKSR